jgi:hypothetical protein
MKRNQKKKLNRRIKGLERYKKNDKKENLKRKGNRTNTHTQIIEHARNLTKIYH